MASTEKRVGRPGFKCALLIVIASAFVLGYLLGGDRKDGRQSVESRTEKEEHNDTGTIWTCSMHPQIRLSKPGQCPLCFMDLIPVKADGGESRGEAVSLRQISLTPQARKLAEVNVEPVVRRAVVVETRMVGKVDYDETRQGYITAWMGGRIDKLYVDYTGSVVVKGQPVASIYSPELLTAQAELIQAVKSIKDLEKSGLARVKDTVKQTELAAREKLRLLGFTKKQIDEVLLRGTPSDHVTLYAPMSGVVIQKDVLEGMYVQTGSRIYTIADLSHVWVVLEAYESDLPWIKLGQEVAFQTDAYPGEIFKGKTVYIDPLVTEKTRTVRVRLDAKNPSGRLKPGMFVRAVVAHSKSQDDEQDLVIPASAPLFTGKRAIVYILTPGKEGTYEGREIVLGPRAGDYYIVKNGLAEGDLVVTKGNFKIDSAVQLVAKPSMMNPVGAGLTTGKQSNGGKAPAGAETGDATTTLEIPPPMAPRLIELSSSYDHLKDVVITRDLQKARQAYKDFFNTLYAIDPSSLTGEASLLWKELTMLLRNDAMIGLDADTPGEADRIFETLTEHYRPFVENFRIESLMRAKAVADSVPAEFKQQLGLVLESYYALQDALAGDDFQGSKRAAEALGLEIKALDMNLVNGEAQQIWRQVLGLFTTGLNKVSQAKDIAGVRIGFEPISIGMAAAVKHLDAATKSPVFEMSCPMAFDDKGAIWLQRDDEIRNPYFGAEMLDCGDVKWQVKAP